MVNILNNPSFEYWVGNYPENWNKNENIGYNAVIEKTQSAHCGDYAILVNGVKSENRRLTSQKICIDGITNKHGRYKLSAYINKSDTEGNAYIKMGYGIIINDAISSSKYNYGDTIEITSSTYTEDPYSYEFEITENCDICIIVMVQKSTPNDAYKICVDCIELINLDDTTSEEPTLPPTTEEPTQTPTYLSIGLYFDAVTMSGNEISSTSNILTVNLPDNNADVSQIPKYKFIYNAVAIEHSCSVYCIYPFIIHYTINNVKYTLTSNKLTDNNYYMDFSCGSFTHGQTYNIVITVDDTNLDENTTINYVDKKLFYNLTAGNEKPFMYSGISNNSFGLVESATNKNYATLVTHGKQIGVSYDDLLAHTNVGIPVLTSVQINALTSANKLPQNYIKINDTNSIYQRTENNSVGDTYVDQMFAAIRSLQAEVTKLRNTFKYGIESYQGKQTAMSSILGTDDTEPEEPMWAITEDGLSDIVDFSFSFDKGHVLKTYTEDTDIHKTGNVTFDNEKLNVTGAAYYNEPEIYQFLTDAYIYLFITIDTINIKMHFKSTVSQTESHPETINTENTNIGGTDIIIDFNNLGLYDTTPTRKKNIMVVISRVHPDSLNNDTDTPVNYYGNNYIYVSVSYWDNQQTIKSGYIDPSSPNNLIQYVQHIGEGDTKKNYIYYPYEIEFRDTQIYKFNAYTRYKDFSNTVLPTLPTDGECEKYKVAHLAIRAFDTKDDADDIKEQLIENELLFITNTKKLYIKSNGKIVAISGATTGDLDEDTMTHEELINELKSLGIIYTAADGSIEMSKLSDITFTNAATGKCFNFECNPYGELVSTEVRTDTIAKRLDDVKHIGTLSNDYEDYRGLIGQLSLLENGTTSLAKTKDAGLASDRIRIGAVYAPTKTDKVFGASHGYIEFANASNKDLNLEGCYLNYCFSTSEGGMQTIFLPLKGVIPAGGTYLIRCKQYADFNSPNTFIKVDKYDMEWYVDGELLDLSMASNGTYGFLLTYGNTIAGTPINHNSKPFESGENSRIDAVKEASYAMTQNFIDSMCIGNKDNCKWTANSLNIRSNTLYKVTFMLDPAKQALNGLYDKDSSRVRWANIGTDYQYVGLENEYITFPHSETLYAISNYTPKASFEYKHVCTDKTQLDKERPNMVYTAFGINNLTTRCFSWTSVGVFNEYVWLKNINGKPWTKFESYKEISTEISNDDDGYPIRKEFPVELNNAAYARIIGKFPADNSQYCTHKCIIELRNQPISAGNAPIKYEYVVGRADKTGNAPDMLHCSDTMEFTLYPEDYTPIIYHTSDQQGFHWIEYQVWNAAAKKLEEKIKADCEGKDTEGNDKKVYPVIINTGDMTQNGTRINEWLDYYEGGKNLFSKYEHAAVVGNNDLCNTDPEILGTGDDVGKSNSFFFHLFFCYEIDITKTGENYNIPLPLCNGKYIPSLYYFNIGQDNRLIMLNGEITKVNCEQWFNIVYNDKPVNIYTGYTIDNFTGSVYAAEELGFTPIYEMVYAMTNDNTKKYIVVCHESPFTVITHASLNIAGAEYANNRSMSGTSLVGSHMNVIHSDASTGPALNWLSRLLEFRGIKLCLCGHKHTYACTYPIRENFKFLKETIIDGETTYVIKSSKVNFDEYIMPSSLKDEVIMKDGQKTNTIEWVWDDNFGTLGTAWENVDHTKFPLIGVDFGDMPSSGEFYPCDYVSDLTKGVRYFMCQATGYKLTSNKELPSKLQKFSQFIPQTDNGFDTDGTTPKDTPNENQKYPMFAIITINDEETDGEGKKIYKYNLKLARVTNIFNSSFKFTQQNYSSSEMTLEYLKDVKYDQTATDDEKTYGKWVASEETLFTY